MSSALLSIGLTGLCLLIASLLPACTPTPEAGGKAYVPVASFQELMTAVVDPAADGVWEAVSVTSSKAGVEETAPRNEAEWTAVRQHALRLVEAANLLLIEGRPIVAAGAKAIDTHVEGVNDAAQIAQAITTQRPQYVAAVQQLQAASRAALAAIDRRDTQQILQAGEALEQACEGCHSRFWYPGAKTAPPYPSGQPGSQPGNTSASTAVKP